MEESEIVTEIYAGDTEKFGLLYDAYFERIYNYLFYRVRDRDTAQDLVSDTFYKAIEAFDSFNVRKGPFSAWIYRIARNTLYDHFRKKKAVNLPDDIADTSDLEGEASDRERVRTLVTALAGLPREQQEIVTMRIWDDMPYADIALVLEKSEASCKMAYHRAVEKLKASA